MNSSRPALAHSWKTGLLALGLLIAGWRSAAATTAAPETTENAYQAYLQALLLESQGNFIAASEELEKAIAQEPDSAYLHRTAAELSLRLGQVNKASKEIERALQIEPNEVKDLILGGQISWALGDSDTAEKRLRKAVQLAPDESEALVSLASALSTKDPKEAIKLYKNFLVRHPGEDEIQERLAQLYQSSGDVDQAKKAWQTALEWSPNSIRAHLALAQIAEVEYDTATAISHYEAVMAFDPTNLPLLLRVGELRYRNNEFAKAYEAFSRAQQIAPNSASVNFWLALLSENRGDWDEAIKLLKQIPNKESDPGILLRLSYYYSQAGKNKEAVQVLEQLVKTDPNNADFLNYLAIGYEQEKELDKAEKALKRIVEISPQEPDAHFQLGSLLDREGKFPQAEKELKKAIELKPDFHMALNYLGYSYADRDVHLDEAEKMVESAVALDPDNAAYLDSMGWVYYKEGRLQKAEDFLRTATSKGDDTLIWEHLGDVMNAKGDKVEAVFAWERSAQLDPKAKGVRRKIDRALAKLSPRDKVGLFLRSALSEYDSISSVNGLTSVRVCQKPPCFEAKAQFSYVRDVELQVEIPGTLSGPMMMLKKEHGKPAQYGAIHPSLEAVEYHVTRAFDRFESFLSADAFRDLDLKSLEDSASNKSGTLVAASSDTVVRFDARRGDVKEIRWGGENDGETLTVGPVETKTTAVLPAWLEWTDGKTKFRVRLTFLSPVVSVAPRTAETRAVPAR